MKTKWIFKFRLKVYVVYTKCIQNAYRLSYYPCMHTTQVIKHSAVKNNNFDILKWLHEFNKEGRSTNAMNGAAINGLEMILLLQIYFRMITCKWNVRLYYDEFSQISHECISKKLYIKQMYCSLKENHYFRMYIMVMIAIDYFLYNKQSDLSSNSSQRRCPWKNNI